MGTNRLYLDPKSKPAGRGKNGSFAIVRVSNRNLEQYRDNVLAASSMEFENEPSVKRQDSDFRW